jgi:hypothetical protein
MRRSLFFYLLFVLLSITCQLPLLILTCRIFLSGLIDNLLVSYLIVQHLLLFLSLVLSSVRLALAALQRMETRSTLDLFALLGPVRPLARVSFDVLRLSFRSDVNLQQELFHIDDAQLLPARSISSGALTVIDNEYTTNHGQAHLQSDPDWNRRPDTHGLSVPSPSLATEALLVMH